MNINLLCQSLEGIAEKSFLGEKQFLSFKIKLTTVINRWIIKLDKEINFFIAHKD